ncbi:MAG: HAMP domain-containing histidine kinase [Rhodocyclaceae bacterium]|jgi:signal transduction histidine kinase|nr:HAMP domain-containing histidine kinase [Rhodocyclaceae bacterium]MCL4758447.1 HAMP domain-containing histidine kinase [Rhodocyclaceae bacterium]
MDDKPMQADVSLFLASAVHDMKNSISMLIGFLQKVVNEADRETFPAWPQLAQMLYETQRINSNLMHLLTLYKVGNHLYPFNPETIPIDEFVTEVFAQNRTLLESKGIELEAEHDPDLYWDFDRDLVAGVINHALNNAIHYTRDRVRLVVLERDGALELHIEDNGRGYPSAMLDEGAAAMRGVDFATGSTGLGLYFSAIVAKMHRTRSHHGEIRLENRTDEPGGRFVLRLP